MDLALNREDFINQYPPFNLLTREGTGALLAPDPAHLYVHLPFCRSRCAFCYYKSFERHDREFVDKYLDHLELELDLVRDLPAVAAKRFRTVYVGGGTPTVLASDQLERLFGMLRNRFRCAPDLELCVEAKPDERDLDLEKLEVLRAGGVTRLSFGVESFNDELLRLNGRQATSASFFRLYEAARKVGFPVINVDMMSGLYGETPENWRATLEDLMKLRPDSIAFYKMEIYFNTRLFKELRQGKTRGELPSDAREIEFITQAFDVLQDEGGYTPVNCLSLVTHPDKDHLHRRAIWSGESMLSVGLSAYSDFDGYVYQNASQLQAYLGSVRQGKLPITRAYRQTQRDLISKYLVYGVKNLELSRRAFNDRFGIDLELVFRDELRELIAAGYLELSDQALRVPRRYAPFADDISRAFFLPEYRTMMVAHVSRAEGQPCS